MTSKSKKYDARMKEREKGFDLRFACSSRRLPEYDALRDVHMRHHFEAPGVQEFLLETGQVDRSGRICSSDGRGGRYRLRIVENEIERAERLRQLTEKEEDDARSLIRKERFRVIEEERRLKKVERQRSETRAQLKFAALEREVLGHSHLWKRRRRSSGELEQKT